MRTRTITLFTTALAASLILSGCSTAADNSTGGADHSSHSTSTPDASTSSEANAADETFATMMIPHHEQAVEMADMILDKDGVDTRVTDLAQQIKDAQAPEIETMTGWLTEWGVSLDSGMAGHDMGDDGMMDESAMTALDDADGADAARLFLEGMLMHHEGAIDMAETELADGQFPDALELAQQVIDGQSAEITTMNDILDTL
ncbi:DUF305 domain-containing protein [Microbacterium sorbitolivorans]|uniref:DUF305 domain-containing protein n=1 Tax=Microbacterium sorbitolivorans TaxID=1867410 RepID=A0A367Y7J5_9MICO|nr:DUF305 domain-containing protein [Microbacterium sorbitolivorans]RCK61808.1 DUF305 domain-containing protein [Microbacterium sorbitolivorans]GGF45516.1 DUF305 domain-containing protein [Microbacterium sorbitolivorans]